MNIEKQHTEADQSKAPPPQDIPVQRDSNGHWWHPAVDWNRIPEDQIADPHQEVKGVDATYLSILADAYTKDGAADCSARYLSHGPAACWLKPFHNATKLES